MNGSFCTNNKTKHIFYTNFSKGRQLKIWLQIDDFYNNGDFDKIDDFNHKDDDSFYNSSELLTGIYKEVPTTAEFC